MNYCPACGTANRDGSRFCNECGHKLPSKTGIMCPMCSHVNPMANVYCDQCHARLIPASPSSPAEPPPRVGTTGPVVDPAAMKKGLSLPTRSAPAETPAPSEPAAPPPPEPEGEAPDWLLRLRATDTTLPAAPVEPPPAPADQPAPSAEEELPDWMHDLGLVPPAPPAPVAPAAAGELPAWMSDLGLGASTPSEAPTAEPEPIQPVEELPDWLKQLEASAASAAPIETAAPEEQPAEAPAQPAKEEVPDWLHELRAEAPAVEEPITEAPTHPTGEEVPDWLSGLRVEAPSVEEPVAEAPTQSVEEEVPDWLHELRTEAPAPAEPTEVAAEPVREEEPDWLRGLRGEAPVMPSTQEPAAEEEPDWLQGLRGPAPAEAGAEEKAPGEQPEWLTPAEAPAAPSEEVPEWLTSITATPATAETPVETEMPDWMKEFAGPSAEAAEAPPETEAPDWLKELGIEQAAPPPAGVWAAPDTGPVAAFIGEPEEVIGATEMPDWLTDIEQPAPSVTEAPAQPVEVPDWLRDLGPMPAGAPPPEGTPFGEAVPAAATELPTWLQELEPGRARPTFADEAGQPLAAEEQPAGAPGLEAAAIPSWLEALRPSDTAAQLAEAAALAGAATETEGVLMGLANVLPASEFMGQRHGAPAIRDVQIPEADLARANLFQDLLGRGSLMPVTLKLGVSRAQRIGARVGRWLVAALLILLVFLPNVDPFADNLFQLGAVDAGQFEPAKRTIDTLNAGDRVLMIFDYDAYQAGEMDAIARAFIRHIGQRGAEVIASSLNPYGTALADRVRQKMEDEGLLMPVVVNRGYAPGQAVGAQTVLAQMAEKPASLIIVLAGSPESLRWWIEQVDAAGLKTPIIAGLSAGALPQAQPYIQSGQVRTAVSGLIAGLAYERDLDPEKDAERDGLNRVVQSQALYLAQLAFALILIVGLFVSLLSRPKPSA